MAVSANLMGLSKSGVEQMATEATNAAAKEVNDVIVAELTVLQKIYDAFAGTYTSSMEVVYKNVYQTMYDSFNEIAVELAKGLNNAVEYYKQTEEGMKSGYDSASIGTNNEPGFHTPVSGSTAQ